MKVWELIEILRKAKQTAIVSTQDARDGSLSNILPSPYQDKDLLLLSIAPVPAVQTDNNLDADLLASMKKACPKCVSFAVCHPGEEYRHPNIDTCSIIYTYATYKFTGFQNKNNLFPTMPPMTPMVESQTVTDEKIQEELPKAPLARPVEWIYSIGSEKPVKVDFPIPKVTPRPEAAKISENMKVNPYARKIKAGPRYEYSSPMPEDYFLGVYGDFDLYAQLNRLTLPGVFAITESQRDSIWMYRTIAEVRDWSAEKWDTSISFRQALVVAVRLLDALSLGVTIKPPVVEIYNGALNWEPRYRPELFNHGHAGKYLGQYKNTDLWYWPVLAKLTAQWGKDNIYTRALAHCSYPNPENTNRGNRACNMAALRCVKPLYKYERENCTYLGQHLDFDLYYSKDSLIAIGATGGPSLCHPNCFSTGEWIHGPYNPSTEALREGCKRAGFD